MKRRPNPATAAVERAASMYDKSVTAMVTHLGPTPYGQQTMTRRAADTVLAQMAPEDIANLATQNPVAAEQAAQRLNVMDARAAASTGDGYSDIGPED